MKIGKLLQIISSFKPVSQEKGKAVFRLTERPNPFDYGNIEFYLDVKTAANTTFTADWGDCRYVNDRSTKIPVQTYESNGNVTHVSALFWLSGQTDLVLSGNGIENMDLLSATSQYIVDADISNLSSIEKLYMSCSKLSSLNASDCSGITSAYFYGTGQDLSESGKMLSMNLEGLESLNNLTFYAISNPVENLPQQADNLTTLNITYDNTKLVHSVQELDLSRYPNLNSAYIEELSTLQVLKCTDNNSIRFLDARGLRSVEDVTISGNANLLKTKLIGFYYDNNPTYAHRATIKDNPSLSGIELDYLNLTGGVTIENCQNISWIEFMHNLATSLTLSGITAPSGQYRLTYNDYVEEVMIKDIPFPRALDFEKDIALKDLNIHGVLSSDCNVSVSYCESLTGVYLSGNSFNQSRLNTIIDRLVSKAPNNGILDLRNNLSGYTPLQSKIDNLVAKGWTVLTD